MDRTRGFTLIEVMMAVAIIGVLASVAIPAYMNYTTRAKSAELIVNASAYRPELEAYASNHGHFPEWSDIWNPTPYIRRIEFWRPSCTDLWVHVYPTKEFHPSVRVGRHAMIYRGQIDDNGDVSWMCTYHPTFRKLPAELFPASCQENIERNVRRRACRM